MLFFEIDSIYEKIFFLSLFFQLKQISHEMRINYFFNKKKEISTMFDPDYITSFKTLLVINMTTTATTTKEKRK